MRFFPLVVSFVLLLLVAGCSSASEDDVGATEPTPEATSTPESTPTPEPPAELDWEDVVELLEPSTVMIRADFPETAVSYEGQGSGSGIVYSEDGYILTNAHVVSGAAAVTVSTSGSPRERSARFVGLSPCDDLAVLQVTDMDGLEPASLGDSSSQRAGGEVATLGYPLGEMMGLDISFSRGVIGQMNDTMGHYERLIQHDASVNSGNSGGPLVDRMGDVVGVNSLFIDPSVGQGMYWAIDINQAKSIMSQLENGENRLWTGMNLEPNFYPDYFGTEEGLVIAAVASGSSASGIGVQPAMLLTHLEGLAVNSMEDVCRVLRSQNEGDSVRVEIMNPGLTEYEFYEGEVVLGGGSNDGAALELVHVEPIDMAGEILDIVGGESEDEETSEVEPVEDPETSEGAVDGIPVEPGIYVGTASVEINYWAPCGEDGGWIEYDNVTYEKSTRVLIDYPWEGEENTYWMQIYSEDEDEGGFWILSSWYYGEQDDLVEYWALHHEDDQIWGEYLVPAFTDYEEGNVIYSNVPVDECTDAEGFELYEMPMSTEETLMIGSITEDSGFLEITGFTSDLYRDFDISIDFVREE